LFLAALCAWGPAVSAQTVMDATGAHRRLVQARKLRQAHAADQSLMLTRQPGPRALKPHQAFDTSGDSLLKGAYFVRQVWTSVDPDTSVIDQAVSLTGTMTFDGNGNYSFTGQELNSLVGTTAVAYSTTGVYAVSASGLVQIATPIDVDNSDTEFGGVGGTGEVVASATEGGYDDIFIAIPEGPASAVTGSYQAGFIDYLDGNASNVRNGYFPMTASGGSFGNVSVTGAMANQGSTTTAQTFSGVTYSFSGSTGTITFPTASNPLTALVSGAKTFAVSPDGNILVGGNPNGFDLLVAVRSASSVSNATFIGTYFQGALENDVQSPCSSDCNSIDSFYGSMALNGIGDGTEHLRDTGFDYSAYDYTSDVPYNFASNAKGIYNDGEFEWMLSANGEALLQVGDAGFYTLVVAFQAQTYSGTGVFLNPVGIVNSASFAPITNDVAPGEYVTLFGSGMGTTAGAPSLPLPDTLGGASVMVDSIPAPLLLASAGLLNILLPNETPTYDFATFVVSVGSASSKPVTVYTASTAPGVFTSTANGVGPADVFHLNYTYVTSANPAVAGETLFFYATGLGATTPSVPDGAAAPSTLPLAQVNDPNLEVDIFDSSGNDTTVTIASAVLVPTLAGVYQINFTVPSGLASGTAYLDVGTTDGYTSEAKISIQ